MAVNMRWYRTHDLCLSVIYILATIQLTIGLALPRINVPSNALPGFKVTDVQKNGQFSELVSDSNIHNLFRIAENGALEIKNSLKHLANSDIALKVRHTLRGQSWDDFIDLHVQDTPLQFSKESYRGYVFESHEANQKIMGLDDLQAASTTPVSYQLAGRDSDNFRLQVNPEGTVQIFTTVPVDRETTSQFHMEIIATAPDTVEATAELVINVNADDNQAPTFVMQSFVSSTFTGAPEGTRVVTIHATDRDEGERGRITYTMESASDVFSLDAKTGVITVSSPLSTKDYNFVVRAQDHGNPPLESLPAEVTVIVRPLSNSFHPYGDDIMYAPDEPVKMVRVRRDVLPGESANLSESAEVDSVVHTITVMGTDLVYAMGTPVNDNFLIDETSGDITLLTSMDFETNPQEILNVEITNSSDSAVFDTLVVTFDIQDADDPPVWAMEVFPYIAVVALDAPNQACIYTLEATDQDPGSVITYSLRTGGGGAFTVGETDGNICTVLSSDIPRYVQDEEYILSVMATGTMGDFVGEVIGTVRIYGGSYPPQFTMEEYSASVVEDQTNNQMVTQVQAKSFLFNVPVTYAIVGPEIRPTHTINPNDGTITLTEPVFVEALPSYFLTVRATEQGGDSLSSEVRVNVMVEDINNCVPTFGQDILSFNDVPETAAIGDTVATVTATDCDVGVNAELTYTITTASSGFDIDSTTGDISPAVPLDYEEGDRYYTFVVMATDGGSTPESSTATVVISIGERDEAPYFTPASYQFRMDETADVAYEVGTVYASDDDVNDVVTLSITDGDNTFTIDQSGVISVSMQATDSSYTFNVLARDSDGKEATATVEIAVTDLNDNIPIFPNCGTYNGVVAENDPIDTEVITVAAQDFDQGSNAEISYKLSSNSDASRFFKIDQNGVILTSQTLDRETTASFEVTVEAEDDGSPALTGFCTFTVEVTDVNDNPPAFPFTAYQTSISTNAEPLDEVIEVQADDADSTESTTLTYSIAAADGAECDTGYFTIRPDSGTVIVRQNLTKLIENGSPNEQSCIVTATDDLYDTDVPVQIDVRSIDDDTYQVPTFSNVPYQVDIPEDSLSQTVLLVSVDGNDAVGFNIIRGSRPSTNLNLNFGLKQEVDARTTSYITVQDALDFESVERYELIVTARYPGPTPYSVQTDVVITIVDVNDEIPIFPAFTFYGNIAENQPAQTAVIKIQATDKDVTPDFSQITYSIDGNQTDFMIIPETGDILSLVTFDRESVEDGTIDLTVRASDGMNENFATVFITIVDENDNQPEFDGTFSFSVAEDEAMGSVIGRVTATDADISGELEYFISGGNDGGAFTVDANSGTIRKAGVLDYETQISYELEYSVNDGKNTETTTVVVNITNVNDVAPQFGEPSYTATVVEEDATNLPRILLAVDATDGDAGAVSDAVVYALLGTGAGTLFTIDSDTGNITLTGTLDREDIPRYTLSAMATDDNGNGLSSYVDVIIEVEDINDNAPSFPDQEYVGSVEENMPPGTPVLVVAAEDLDTGDTLVYSFPTSNDDFNINSETGEITTKRQLDRETQPAEFVFEVQVSDGENTASTPVIVRVEDVDDNRPIFTEDSYPAASVSESEGEGFIITTVQAIDPDVDFMDEVVFTINSGDPDNLFRIVADPDTLTGLIEVNKPLDFESGDPTTYQLTIQVEDSQGPTDSGRPETATIQILITNANDLAPVFDQDTYEGSVSEAAAPGTQVGDVTVLATDGDEPGVDLNYVIDPTTDPEGQFAINANRELVVDSPLDRETVANYELKVFAIDNGEPPMTGTATINVVIEDVNDTPPRFAEDYTPSVEENSNAEINVVSVMAVDDDDPASGPPFTYNVASTPADWEGYFSIAGLGQSTSGSITVRTNGAEIDRETFPYFDIVFLIGEVNTPEALTGTQTLTIMITDVNDNPHGAVTKNILVYSYEGETPEVSLGNIPTTEVGKVEVEDKDILEDKTYNEVGEFPEYFTLDTDTGDITMLEGTPAGVYSLEVLVSDNKYPDVISTVIVTIKDIPREAVFSSGSIRFSGTTAEELIDPDAEGVSQLDRLKVILAGAVGAQVDNLDIFSVLNVEGMERTVDIRYAAHGSPYYPADQLDLGALAVADQISALGLTIDQLPLDLCVDENVCESSCTNVLVVDQTPTVVDSGAASFVAITSVLQAQCICGARTETPGSCESAPCLNGGTCVDVHGGTYRCECPYLFDGPNCQQTKRSFNDGYATFTTLRQCEETSLSIEFITEVSSGTLFYNGPIQDVQVGDAIDMILLELVGGKAQLTINLGSTNETYDNLVLEVPKGNLGDGEWHRIDIYRNGRYVEMTVDRCEDATFAETPASTTLDTANCRTDGETPGENKFLNVNTPLFLGGMSPDYNVNVPGGFDGCIKNLVSDGFLYDLATPGISDKSDSGCLRTDGQCEVEGIPVCENGICEADMDSYVCICDPGFSGTTCNNVLPPYDFAMESYVTYELIDNTLYNDARSSNYHIMVRTREQSGLIWSISSANTYEFIRMEMVDGELQADWHLGDKPVSVTMENFSLNDGAWHAIIFDRYDGVVTIKIDGGGGVKEIQNRESEHSGLDVDANSLVIGAFVDVNTITDDFIGCMNDPRINNNFLGLDGSNDFAVATKSAGVTEGCPSDVCSSNPCPGQDLVCMDHWRFWECQCPVGEELTAPETCSSIIDCNPNPCKNGGTCTEGDPFGFNCTCAPNWYGEICDVTTGGRMGNLGITTLGICLLILCILLIIFLLLSLVFYTRQRDRKSALAFAVDPEDDIRENFINYDEEGGGEEDNDAYDLSTLRKPVDAISAGSIEKKPVIPVASEIPVGNRPPGVDPNVGDFINDRLKGANDDADGPPYDEPHIYDYEGDGSTAGSLSSLNSSSTESEQNYDYLNDWGPQFRKLADMYGS